MKFLLASAVLLLSLEGPAHCGACGEGTAEDHKAKGEDSSHHTETQTQVIEEETQASEPVKDEEKGPMKDPAGP